MNDTAGSANKSKHHPKHGSLRTWAFIAAATVIVFAGVSLLIPG